MKSLVQLRMMQHEKVMRQMVSEIHRGKLNIDQAAAKFEITRKTVQHWIDIVEEDSEAPRPVDTSAIIRPAARKKKGRSLPLQDDRGQTEELKAQIQTLEKELEEANRDGGPFQSSLLLHFSASRRAGTGRRSGKKVRYRNVGPQPIRIMLMNYPHLHIRQLEGCLGFSRQAYYQYWQRQSSQGGHEATVVELVKELRKDHPQMGGRKLYDLLREAIKTKGIKMGRDALFDLLAYKGLLIRKKRRSVRTTFSQHRFRKYPNLIKELVIERPNQVWVSDITYWFTHYGCLYITLVTDAYSKRVMAGPPTRLRGCPNFTGRPLQSGFTDGPGAH